MEEEGRPSRNKLKIAIICGLVLVGCFLFYMSRPKLIICPPHSNAKTQMSTLCTALEHFRMETGRFPTETEGLQALVEKPAGLEKWDGPYLDPPRIQLDPWGMPYMYYTRGTGEEAEYLIVSYGPSKKPGPGNIGSKDMDPAAWLSGKPAGR